MYIYRPCRYRTPGGVRRAVLHCSNNRMAAGDSDVYQKLEVSRSRSQNLYELPAFAFQFGAPEKVSLLMQLDYYTGLLNKKRPPPGDGLNFRRIQLVLHRPDDWTIRLPVFPEIRSCYPFLRTAIPGLRIQKLCSLRSHAWEPDLHIPRAARCEYRKSLRLFS